MLQQVCNKVVNSLFPNFFDKMANLKSIRVETHFPVFNQLQVYYIFFVWNLLKLDNYTCVVKVNSQVNYIHEGFSSYNRKWIPS